MLDKIRQLSLKIADAASEGLVADGSMIYEKDRDHTDRERHWWVQAEAVVGYMYACKNSREISYKEKAARIWHYIQNQITDKHNGEWIWSVWKMGRLIKKTIKPDSGNVLTTIVVYVWK